MGNDQIEKATYRPHSYRAVQRLRVRAAEYGIDIPYLQQPFTAPHTGGAGLKVMIVLSGLLIALGVGFLIWGVVAVLAPWIGTMGQSSTEIAESIKGIPVLDLFGAIGIGLLWTLVVGVLLLAVAVAGGAVAYLITLLRVAQLSTEEKAVGYFWGRLKTQTLIMSIILVIAGVVCTIFVLPVGIVVLLAAAYAVALFIVLQKERNLAKVAFDQLPEANKADFIAHTQAIKTALSRREIRRYHQRGDYRGMGKWALLLKLLEGFADARLVYDNLKTRPEFAAKSTGLARRAWRDLLIFGVTAAVVIGLVLLSGGLSGGSVWQVFVAIAGGVFLFFEFLVLIPQTLNYSIKQIILNKHPLGWLALVTTVVMVAVVVGLLCWVASI